MGADRGLLASVAVRVAVVGGGVVGLSTAVALVERGIEVTCYERGAPMAQRSAGETRIFRLAHAYPDLVDLAAQARRAFAGWSGRAGETLIEPVGTVVSGGGAPDRARAMAEAGAEHELVEAGSALLRLPGTVTGPALVDPAGGVIRVDRINAFLTAAVAGRVRRAHVYGVEETVDGVRIWAGNSAGGGADIFDTAVICAGAGTSALAATVGLYTPPMLEHHVRFSFPVRGPGPFQCWITDDDASTYQHVSTPGTWTVGATVDRAAVAWEVGPEAAEEASREVVTSFVKRRLPAVEPRVVGRLYCAHNPDLGDGFRFLRQGRVLAMYGENLFKFAPLLGTILAGAAVDGSTPASTGPLTSVP
jgi:sarcosine oxidase